MNIRREGDQLILILPLKQKENNSYMDDEDLNETDNLIGVIAGREYSISQLNDLSYKGSQQEGSPYIMFDTREELEKVCKEFGIDIWEHPVCTVCGEALRGVHTWGDKGPECSEHSNNKPL